MCLGFLLRNDLLSASAHAFLRILKMLLKIGLTYLETYFTEKKRKSSQWSEIIDRTATELDLL